MKMKKNIFLQITSFLVIALSMQSIIAGTFADGEDVAMVQSEAVIEATAQTKLMVEKAMQDMDEARQKLFTGDIDAMQAAVLIKGKVSSIAYAKQGLQQIITQAVQKVEANEEQGYLDYFISGAKNIGNKIIAPFKSDYGYTQQDKELASKIISGLTEQQDKLTKEYTSLISKKRLTVKDSYQALIAQLNNEINEQQRIAGDEIDAKKVFYAIALAGAAVAGMALLAPGEAAEIIKEKQSIPTGQEILDQPESPKLGEQIVEQPKEVIKNSELPLASDTSLGLPQSDVSLEDESYLKAEQDRVRKQLEKEESAIDPINLPENPKAIARTHEEYVAGLSPEDAEKKREHDINMGYVAEDVSQSPNAANGKQVNLRSTDDLDTGDADNPDNGTDENGLPKDENQDNPEVQQNPGSTNDLDDEGESNPGNGTEGSEDLPPQNQNPGSSADESNPVGPNNPEVTDKDDFDNGNDGSGDLPTQKQDDDNDGEPNPVVPNSLQVTDEDDFDKESEGSGDLPPQKQEDGNDDQPNPGSTNDLGGEEDNPDNGTEGLGDVPPQKQDDGNEGDNDDENDEDKQDLALNIPKEQSVDTKKLMHL